MQHATLERSHKKISTIGASRVFLNSTLSPIDVPGIGAPIRLSMMYHVITLAGTNAQYDFVPSKTPHKRIS